MARAHDIAARACTDLGEAVRPGALHRWSDGHLYRKAADGWRRADVVREPAEAESDPPPPSQTYMKRSAAATGRATPEQRRAVAAFTTNGSHEAMRRVDAAEDEDAAGSDGLVTHVRALNQFLAANAVRVSRASRGLAMSPEQLRAVVEAGHIDIDAFTSFSEHDAVAKFYASGARGGQLQVRIVASGLRGAAVDGLSATTGEAEYIMPKGQRLRVTDVVPVDDQATGRRLGYNIHTEVARVQEALSEEIRVGYVCPRCQGRNARYRTSGEDTSNEESYLWCPDCKLSAAEGVKWERFTYDDGRVPFDARIAAQPDSAGVDLDFGDGLSERHISLPVGSRRRWGGNVYIKTHKGWARDAAGSSQADVARKLAALLQKQRWTAKDHRDHSKLRRTIGGVDD